ncbi:MAG TPA: hypothetical protein PLO28_06280 [bacterium]|nr:hypothetical protein [bacterium]
MLFIDLIILFSGPALIMWTANELRSVNGQIEFILRQAVARRKRNSNNKSA